MNSDRGGRRKGSRMKLFGRNGRGCLRRRQRGKASHDAGRLVGGYPRFPQGCEKCHTVNLSSAPRRPVYARKVLLPNLAIFKQKKAAASAVGEAADGWHGCQIGQ